MCADPTGTCGCLEFREVHATIDFSAAKRVLESKQMLEGGGIDRAASFQKLYDAVPNTVEYPQSKEIVILTPDVKALIIGYAFIGACELMAHSSGQTVEFVRDGIIKRSMLNLKRDGLL